MADENVMYGICPKCSVPLSEEHRHHIESPRADKNILYVLIDKLMIAGFRGSAQCVVDEAIEEYQQKVKEKS